MDKEPSLLEQLRKSYHPSLPPFLRNPVRVVFAHGETTGALSDEQQLKELFPLTFGRPIFTSKEGFRAPSPVHRVGVVLSGGQAAGGHNVIAGLFDALKMLHPESQLYGFLDGPSGIINGKFKELTKPLLDEFRNLGGFDLIGSGRTKIETEEQLQASLATMQKLRLDGLVIIGGDDSNTNAAILAEYFLGRGCTTSVIGVPKTIDGDLKNDYVEVSFGFDTACKVYSEMIGNIARDALSAKKYYHFVKLMGRSASHITLECALTTHPNIALIGEEIAQRKKTLTQITGEICDVICKRAELGKNYGVILIPEGLIEFIPEVGELIKELNHHLAGQKNPQISEVLKKLTPASAACFQELPETIQKQLLLDRDPHGNVQVSLIETERLFIKTVAKELQKRKEAYKGKFSAVHHFFGYEGRAAFPSNFDSNYCYALGFTAALLVDEKLTGYMCFVSHLTEAPSKWTIGGIPIIMLLNLEKRHGHLKPVIQKALVDLKGKPFSHFQGHRQAWALEDNYRFPGPIQFFGDPQLTDAISMTLNLE